MRKLLLKFLARLGTKLEEEAPVAEYRQVTEPITAPRLRDARQELEAMLEYMALTEHPRVLKEIRASLGL